MTSFGLVCILICDVLPCFGSVCVVLNQFGSLLGHFVCSFDSFWVASACFVSFSVSLELVLIVLVRFGFFWLVAWFSIGLKKNT